MGGKAFPNLKTVRLNKDEFETFSNACLIKLETIFPENEFRIIMSFRNKESFGDLDILWCGSSQSIEILRHTLGAVAVFDNGPVVSYAVPTDNDDSIFQVDLIRVDCCHMESAFSYFAFNDLGNLLGRIFHRAGFKLGHKGMCFVVREEGNQNNVLKEIEVTTSWKKTLEFAGYDFDRWLEGFDDLEDVFKFAVSIPIANRTIFRLNEINHQARVRDRKRLTYQKFLCWVNDSANNVPEHEDVPKTELRKKWLERAFKTFPDFLIRFNEVTEEMKKIRESNSKFNGNIVRELTGLNGKELGEFMQDFIKNVINGTHNKVVWSRSNSKEFIECAILAHFMAQKQ